MPPKPKYTRNEVVIAAFNIIKRDGLSALTARELGKSLGTSVSPIFTTFKNMEEVKMAARELAMAEFREYISDYINYTPAFKRIGVLIVSYGIKQPELFKLLFMQEHSQKEQFRSTLDDLGDMLDVCINLIIKDYDMTKEEAEFLFEQLWIQAYGLGVMCAMKVCSFTEEEIGMRLGGVFASLAMFIKSGKANEVYAFADKRQDRIFQGRSVTDIPYKID